MTERPAGAVKLSLVIPTYNESRNLAELVGRLSAVLDTCLSGAYELLVVDDPDDTWALALQLADRFPALRVMRRRGEKGLSTAVIRGWQAARGEVLAVIDADLQHPAEPIWNDLWTFGDLAEKQGYGMARLRRFAKFNGICAARLVLSVGLLESGRVIVRQHANGRDVLGASW